MIRHNRILMNKRKFTSNILREDYRKKLAHLSVCVCKCVCLLSFMLLPPSSLFPTLLSFQSRPSLALILAPVLPLFPCACQTTQAKGAVGGVESNSDSFPITSQTAKTQSSQGQRETKREGGGAGCGGRGGGEREREREGERE
jgi:hypothetical protein